MNKAVVDRGADDYVKSTLVGSPYIKKSSFIAGAKFLCNSIWHDETEVPEYDKKLIFMDSNNLGKYLGGEWNHKGKWAYFSDILPEDN